MKIQKFGLGLLIAVAVAAAPMTGCKKTLDVNQNPNALADVSAKQLLSSAEVSIAQAYGNYFQIVGGFWAQYWTQNPVASQYKSFDQYDPGPSSPNNVWALLYSGVLKDLDQLIKKNENPNYNAVAMLLKAYTFQLLTDNFGDIPYSEALRADDGITSPKFESQQTIYDGLISMTQQGLALIDDDAGGAVENDVIFSGNMDHWREFGNTLLLRLYLRLAYVNPSKAQQGIQAFSATTPFLDDVSADVMYSASAGNDNPLYSESHALGNQNIIASKTAIDSFSSRGDPRIESFYFDNGTPFRGLRQGDFNSSTSISYAYPGSAVGGIANPLTSLTLPSGSNQSQETQSAPVRLLSNYESLFLQAEAVARGWLTTGGSDGMLVEQAVRRNLGYYVNTGDDSTNDALTEEYISDVLNYPMGGTTSERIGAIITEKYYAMCGNQNIEAWTEWRRTGFPTFFQISIAPGAGSRFPSRLPYPETELTRNLNFPGQKSVFDRVYWDIN